MHINNQNQLSFASNAAARNNAQGIVAGIQISGCDVARIPTLRTWRCLTMDSDATRYTGHTSRTESSSVECELRVRSNFSGLGYQSVLATNGAKGQPGIRMDAVSREMRKPSSNGPAGLKRTGSVLDDSTSTLEWSLKPDLRYPSGDQMGQRLAARRLNCDLLREFSEIRQPTLVTT